MTKEEAKAKIKENEAENIKLQKIVDNKKYPPKGAIVEIAYGDGRTYLVYGCGNGQFSSYKHNKISNSLDEVVSWREIKEQKKLGLFLARDKDDAFCLFTTRPKKFNHTYEIDTVDGNRDFVLKGTHPLSILYKDHKFEDGVIEI